MFRTSGVATLCAASARAGTLFLTVSLSHTSPRVVIAPSLSAPSSSFTPRMSGMSRRLTSFFGYFGRMSCLSAPRRSLPPAMYTAPSVSSAEASAQEPGRT